MTYDIFNTLRTMAIEPELHPRTLRPINKPKWLKSALSQGSQLYSIKNDLRKKKLFTVCEEAKCPNISGCWNTGTATFMILGDTCTRACRFCHVKTGNPQKFLDEKEPYEVADTVKELKLKYAVITMVDRDDLDDGGASHISKTVSEVQKQNPSTLVEILSGDFKGQREALNTVVNSGRGLDVFAHNMETVKRLTPRVRDARANYDQSLTVLKNAKKLNPKVRTKSSVMLGLSEDYDDMMTLMSDLKEVGVDFLTFGQYLQPTYKHLKVKKFIHPDEFNFWKDIAYKMGFKGVASGPLVRSSFRAAELFLNTT